MYTDPRGGHNKKLFNKDFFKVWSPQMAYVLGYIYADGAIEDVRASSRTCYITVTSIDRNLLEKVKKSLSSEHNLYIKREHFNIFPDGKRYLCREAYILRIGSKYMYEDLIRLGVTPRKSLTLKFPKIPTKLLNHFIRGYFDGDGCVRVSVENGKKLSSIKTIFTCGSLQFLTVLNFTLNKMANSRSQNIIHGAHAYQLGYKKYDSLKILDFMYKDLDQSPFLDRKYNIYKTYKDSL